MKISEAIELFNYNCTNKISIVMICDDGKEEEKLKPTLYREIKFFDVKDYLKYDVFSIYINKDRTYFEIRYCDQGEWK